MRRLLLIATLACAGCWDFESLSAKLGADLAPPDLAGLDLAPLAPDAGIVGAPCPGFSCVDFESALPSPWVFDVGATGDVAEIVTTRAHGGARSLHVLSTSATNAWARVRDPALPTNVAGATFYMRYWVLVPAATSTSPYTLYSIVEDGAVAMPVDVGTARDGSWMFSTGAGETDDVAPFTIDQWMCVIAQIASTNVSVTIDGIPSSVMTTTVAPPTAVNIGIARATPSTPTEAYVDDIVLSLSPIACN